MDVVRHKAIGMQAARCLTEQPSQMKQIEAAIVVFEKAGLPVVAAVDDVYRYAWKHEASASWHAGSTSERLPSLTENVVCP
jgi:hypothetical protein